MGFSSRSDRAAVGLFRQKKRQRLSTTTDSIVNQTNLAWYAQQELRPTPWLRTQIGGRLDKFFFDVRDTRPVANKNSGEEEGFIANPKVNIILSPFTDNVWAKRSEVYLNFAGGYHSNDARDVIANPNKITLPRVLGGEIGFRTKLLDRLDMGLAYWRSHLESELVLVGDEGTTEARGKTQRQGVEGEFRYDILSWLAADLDISYTWSKFVKTGQAIPLAPRFLALSGITARHPSGLEGRIQLRSVGDRYGTEDRTFNVRGYNIFDLLLKYKWDRYEILFSIDNIANTKWRAAQFVFESQLPGEAAPVRDFHFTPGDPLTIRASIAVHLW